MIMYVYVQYHLDQLNLGGVLMADKQENGLHALIQDKLQKLKLPQIKDSNDLEKLKTIFNCYDQKYIFLEKKNRSLIISIALLKQKQLKMFNEQEKLRGIKISNAQQKRENEQFFKKNVQKEEKLSTDMGEQINKLNQQIEKINHALTVQKSSKQKIQSKFNVQIIDLKQKIKSISQQKQKLMLQMENKLSEQKNKIIKQMKQNHQNQKQIFRIKVLHEINTDFLKKQRAILNEKKALEQKLNEIREITVQIFGLSKQKCANQADWTKEIYLVRQEVQKKIYHDKSYSCLNYAAEKQKIRLQAIKMLAKEHIKIPI